MGIQPILPIWSLPSNILHNCKPHLLRKTDLLLKAPSLWFVKHVALCCAQPSNHFTLSLHLSVSNGCGLMLVDAQDSSVHLCFLVGSAARRQELDYRWDSAPRISKSLANLRSRTLRILTCGSFVHPRSKTFWSKEHQSGSYS